MTKVDDTITRTEESAAVAEKMGLDEDAEFFRGAAKLWREVRDDFRRIGVEV